MENKNEILKCKNCGSTIDQKSKFCNNCGQQLKNKKVSFKEIISDFFNTFFIFDFKLFSSLKAIFIPGKLTQDYFSGKHGSYNSPWRIFFVSVVFMLIVVGFDTKINLLSPEKKEIKNNEFNLDNLNFYKTEGFNISLDTTKTKGGPKFTIDSIKNQLSIDEYKNINNLYVDFDTAFKYSNDNIKFILDSSFYVMNSLLKNIYFDSVRIFDTKVSKYDLKNLSIPKLREKYKTKRDTSVYDQLLNRFLYNQNRNGFDSDKLIEFLVQNLNWFIIFLLPFAALIFKLLYIRRKRFLIEHLVFNLHNHAAILFLFSFYTIFEWLKLGFFQNFEVLIIIFGPILYYLISMKKYYSQSWIKTIIKTILFVMFYSFTMFILGLAYIILAAVSLFTFF